MDIIVDIDGTLADCTHRLHHIQKQPKDWDAFFAATAKDKPIQPMCDLLRALILGGARPIYVTGRPEKTRKATEDWLERFNPTMQPYAIRLYMRADGDHRNDDILKREMLNRIRRAGFAPKLAFEDRSRVVQMYRKAGLICLQVAEGNF
jgi:phosphoglycolate phosphatase-like HAD superfamily hydrolase